VPTLLEIAEHADVPVEGVVKVLNGQPVSEVVAERVTAAMEALGPPHHQLVESMNLVEPSRARAGDVLPLVDSGAEVDPVDDVLARAREQLLASFSHAAAEFEARLPQGVSSVVYEALRVEVGPVAQHMARMGTLFDELGYIIQKVEQEVGAARQERLEDLKLLIDLIESSWRNVDRRLGRLERKLERLEGKAPF
jgi:Bacterial regulatory proteins, lacI family